MKTYTIETAKSALKFSSAHIATFADGSIERLHGHNYMVRARLSGQLDEAGMVLDVAILKNWTREICDELDELFLVATENPLIQTDVSDSHVHLTYQKKTYSIPREDCILLPIANTTMEHLGHYIAERLAERMQSEPAAKRMTRLEVTVSETPQQYASWSLRLH